MRLTRADFTKVPALLPSLELRAQVLKALHEDEDVEVHLNQNLVVVLLQTRRFVLLRAGESELRWGDWRDRFGVLDEHGECGEVFVTPDGEWSYVPPPSPFPKRLPTPASHAIGMEGWLPEAEQAALQAYLGTGYYREVEGGWLIVLLLTNNGKRVAVIHRFHNGKLNLRFLGTAQGWNNNTKWERLTELKFGTLKSDKVQAARDSIDPDGRLLLR